MADTKWQNQDVQAKTWEARVVWLVDDNLEEAERIVQTLRETSPGARLVHLSDCEYALGCLQSQPQRRPALILLALNEPTRRGLHFIRMLKADEKLKTIPIVALAQAGQEGDVFVGYELGLAGFVLFVCGFSMVHG